VVLVGCRRLQDLIEYSLFGSYIILNFSVGNIQLLSRALEMSVDWQLVLNERWTLRGDKAFFNDLKSSGTLTPAFITAYLQR